MWLVFYDLYYGRVLWTGAHGTGIIGEYLGKIILSLNNTPQYIVRETVNIEEKDGAD